MLRMRLSIIASFLLHLAFGCTGSERVRGFKVKPAHAVVHLFESMYLVPDRSEWGSVWLHCFFSVVIFLSLSTLCHLFMPLMFEAYPRVSFQINILFKLPFQKQLLLKINVSHVTLSCVPFPDKIHISANKDKSNGGCQHSVIAN